MVEASFDTTLSRARADRRLTYDAGGRVVKVESDLEGDGTFVPVEMTRNKGEAR